MAADPIIYCLEQVTDYDQFERFCHDLMALSGYPDIEPLGGSKDKGRDALNVARNGQPLSTVFAYSVREDWFKKLREDADKVKKWGQPQSPHCPAHAPYKEHSMDAPGYPQTSVAALSRSRLQRCS